MATKQSVLQVRMDDARRRDAVELYRHIGMTLPEAVRIFIAQSLEDRGMPFKPHAATSPCKCKAYGVLKVYGDPHLRGQERAAWIRSLSKRELEGAHGA